MARRLFLVLKKAADNDAVIAAVVLVATAACYVSLTRPGVGFGDAAEFALRPAFLAPGHYPGYPFPNQLFYLPSLVARTPAHAGAVLNALFGAAAVAALYVSARLGDVRRPVAAALALAFAFTPAVWVVATGGPEVYTLEVLTAALVVALTLAAWRRQDPRFSLAAWFVFGLALGNRTSFAVFALWLGVAFFVVPRRRLDLAVTAAALGASVYGMMVLRWLSVANHGPEQPYVNALLFARKMATVTCASLSRPAELKKLFADFLFQAKYPPLLLALLGVGVGFRRRVWAAAPLFVLFAFFVWTYKVYVGPPYEPYMVLPLWGLFTFAAWGGDALYRRLLHCPKCAVFWGLLFFTLPAYNLTRNYGFADHRFDRGAMSFVTQGFRTMAYRGAVAGEHTNFMPFAYYRWVMGARPDLILSCFTNEKWERELIQLQRNAGPTFRPCDTAFEGRPRRPIYLVTTFPRPENRAACGARFMPEDFLAERLAALRPGECFVLLAGDVAPAPREPMAGLGRRKDKVARYSRTGEDYDWRSAGCRFPLRWDVGASTVVAGRREGAGVAAYAAVKRGPASDRLKAPPKGPFPSDWPVVFKVSGDDGRFRTGMEFGLPGARFRMPSSGVLFVALDRQGKLTGPPGRYYFDGDCLHYVFVVGEDRAP
jgi:hypothetical protein